MKNKNGYAVVLSPEHPRADRRGYVREHILIAEKVLGRLIPRGVLIHHANGTKDSGPLVICQDDAYHNLLHQRMRALEACGNVHWRKCVVCKEYDDPKNLTIYSRPGGLVRHKSCMSEYMRNRRRALAGTGVPHLQGGSNAR